SLGLAVINERVAAAVEEAWISPLRRARTAMDGILRAFENIAESLDKQGRVLGCPLNNLAVELSTADPDFQAAVTQVYQAWKSAIVEKLKADKSQLAGRIKPDELATLVVAAYSGAIAL